MSQSTESVERVLRTYGRTDGEGSYPPVDISPVRYARRGRKSSKEHGERRTYQAGCRCGTCRKAAADYERWRDYDEKLGRPRVVDATGTLRRIQALQAIGYTAASIATRLGVFPTNLPRLGGGGVVLRSTAEKVTAVYDELSMTPGPSSRARDRARRNGWAPPLAWDDDTIDDPRAAPQVAAAAAPVIDEVAVERFLAGDESVTLTRAEKIEAVRRRSRAMSDAELLRRVGFSGKSARRVRAG